MVIGAAAFTVFLSSASAGTMTIDYGSRHSGSGGEFRVNSADFNPSAMGYAANTTVSGGFETFCLEANEYFTPGGTYYYEISQGAVNGGISGGNPDPVSLGSAWLYVQFAQGTLTGYDYATLGSSSVSAATLQEAIWWLEGEAAGQDLGNAYENLAIAHFGSVAAATADNDGFYGVGVLNVWGDANHTQLAQDQLVLVPDGGTTVMLLGLGLLGLVLGGRKFRAVKA